MQTVTEISGHGHCFQCSYCRACRSYSAMRKSSPIDVSGLVGNRHRLSGEASIVLAFSFKPEPSVAVNLTQPVPVLASMREEHPLTVKRAIALRDLTSYPVLLHDTGIRVRPTGSYSTLPWKAPRSCRPLRAVMLRCSTVSRKPFPTQLCRQGMSRSPKGLRATGSSRCRLTIPCSRSGACRLRRSPGVSWTEPPAIASTGSLNASANCRPKRTRHMKGVVRC